MNIRKGGTLTLRIPDRSRETKDAPSAHFQAGCGCVQLQKSKKKIVKEYIYTQKTSRCE
ncbi:MAG: hypothetical protein Q4E89_10300 [Eubacteriales bacterium]|nr:hypothetical protein [Eubacteriales bacterium]